MFFKEQLLSAGQYNVQTTSNKLFAWGLGTSGQLTTLPYIYSIAQLSTGASHALAITSDNRLLAWGLNSSGQLGDGTTQNKSFPVQVGSTGWKKISAGASHSVALRADDVLFAWGTANNGALGIIPAINRSNPTQVTSSISYISLSSGNDYTLAVTTAGILYGWGLNSSGQLGNGNTVARSSPVVIAPAVNMADTSANAATLTFDLSAGVTTFVVPFANFPDTVANNGISASLNLTKTIASGAADQIRTPSRAEFAISNYTDYTIEAWIYPLELERAFIYSLGTPSASLWQYFGCTNNIGTLQWGYGNGTWASTVGITTASNAIVINIWQHIALVKQGTTYRILINGQSAASGTLASVPNGQGGTLFIGTYFNNVNNLKEYLRGYISNFRIVAGTAVYPTVPISVPFSPLTAISGTQFLLGYTTLNTVPSFTQVYAGGATGYGIATDGLLYTWGLNTSGQMGDGTAITKSRPTLIGTSSWSIVNGGFDHAAAIRIDGALFTWGNNNAGQLGIGTTINRSNPVQLGSGSWSKVSAGNSFTLGLDTTSILYGWGRNNLGQIGLVTNTVNRSAPIQITTGSWNLISVGDFFSTATNDNDLLYSWGSGSGGTQADGSTIARSSPVLVSFNQTISQSSPIQIGAESWTSITAGVNFFLAIRSDNLLYAWGTNSNGQLAQNDAVVRSSPVLIGTSSWVAVAATFTAGIDTVLAIRSDYTLWGWGLNTIGLTNSLTSWIQVTTGQEHSVALRSDNTVWCWGQGVYGSLGNNSTITRSSPVQAGTASNWTMVTTTQNQSSGAINSLGELYMWGNNQTGDLAINVAGNRSNPTLVPFNTLSWTFVAGTGAITNDGKLWKWGVNSTGAIGDGTTINKSSPVHVGVGTSFTFVTNHLAFTGAIDTTGRLWTWGINTSGALGINDAIDRSNPVLVSTPVQIQSISWVAVAATDPHMLGLTTTGALYAWGRNNEGQLGDGTTLSKSTPIQIGASSWAAIGVIASASVAVRSDGALFTWGSGANNRLGDGTLVSKSSPIQITGGGNWGYSRNGFRVISTNRNGSGRVLLLRADGAVYGWGDGALGALGNNAALNITSPVLVTATLVAASSPVLINSSSSWTQAKVGFSAAAAINNIGELYTWGGDNQWGTLGSNNVLNTLSPAKVGTSSWSNVSVGNYHILAITSDNRLFAWGLGTAYQLGDDNAVNRSSPIQIGTPFSWIAVAAGNSHSLAIRADSTLFAWGLNNVGQLGIVSDANSWAQIAQGFSHALAISSNNTLWGWGLNNAGQLGTNNTLTVSSPTQIGTSSWTQVSANNSVTMAIRSDNILFTWGVGGNLQIGDGFNLNRSSPVQIGTSSWSQISMGASHALAIDAQGRLFGWGMAAALYASTAPFSWTVVSENTSHTAAIRSDGLLFVWGLNTSGQVGDNTIISRSSPVQIGLSSWIAVSAGQNHTLGITNDNRMFAWGGNAQYQLGDNSTVNKSSPVQIGVGLSWSQVDAATSISLAITTTNTLYVWGLGTSGQLGSLTQPLSFTSIAAGDRTTLAIRNNGRLYGWGLNTSFQIGDGSSISKSSPVQVAGSLSYSQVSAGPSHTLAITNNGELYGWGVATTGATGNFGEVYSWNMVAGSGDNTFFIRSDGSLWATGPNTLGVLGLNDTFARSSPVQVGTSSWIFVNAGGSASGPVFGITSDYKLFSWGANDSGQCADGSTIRKSSPVQIGIGSSWIQAATGGSGYSLMLKSDYTLWTAGIGLNGRLGLNDVISRSNPTQIGTSSWTQIAVGSASLAIRVDNTLWSWGVGNFGQLGIGVTTDRSSPVQVTTPGTGPWLAVAANEEYSLAISGAGLGTPYSVYFIGGANIYGQAGLNTAVGSISLPTLTKAGAAGSSFVQVTTNGLPNADFVNHALTSDGKIWGWGYNVQGMLGDGTIVSKSSPVLVTGTTSWSQLPKRNAGRLTYGIATNNILWGWGLTPSYVTYNADPIQVSNPIQIGGNIRWANYNSPIYAINSEAGQGSWTSVAAGNSFSLGIKNNNLYGWGNNNLGQTGTNQTTTPILSPTQTGTSSWSVVSASELGNFAGAIRSDNKLFMWGNGVAETALYYNISNYSWVQVSCGWTHVVGIKSDGSLWAWGGNGNGQIGNNSTLTQSSPIQIGTSSWLQVACGGANTYAIRIDGTLWAWGSSFNGQLGDGTGPGNNKSSPVQIGTSSWAMVAAGGQATAYGILSNGGLYSWGNNNLGQLGITSVTAGGDTINRSSPTLVTSTLSWTSVFAGGRVVGAIKTDQSLWMWGENGVGALGNNTGAAIHRSSPVQVTGNWKQVCVAGGYAGGNATVAIRSDNTLWGWGSSAINGDVRNIQHSSPVQIGTSQWTQVASGGYSMQAFDANKRLFVWGRDFFNGSLGLNDSGITRSSPTLLPAPAGTSWSLLTPTSNNSTFDDVLNGWYFTVNKAIASDGNLYMWGNNRFYQIDPTLIPIDRSNPVVFAGSWVQVAQLYSNTFLLPALPQYTSSPVQIGNSSWSQLSTGASHTLAIRADGTLWTWGTNASSQLGFGDTVTRSSPTQLGSESNWSIVSAGFDHSMAIKTNNTLYGWGSGALGQIGLLTSIYSWNTVSSNNSFIAAIRSDGLLFSWGINANGQLGLGDTINRSSPTQIGNESWTAVATGYFHTVAVRNNVLYAWGRNGEGQLGDNSAIAKSSPVIVTGSLSWTKVACGGYHSMGITSTNELYGWGYNGFGQLGLNAANNRSNPVYITDAYEIRAGANFSIVNRYDQVLVTMGENDYFQLGDNTSINRSSPVVVSGLNVGPGTEVVYGDNGKAGVGRNGGNGGGNAGGAYAGGTGYGNGGTGFRFYDPSGAGGGGGGGGGFFGGGGGPGSSGNGSGWPGGGGSGFVNSMYVTSSSLTAANFSTPGNSSDPDRSTAGRAGTTGETNTATNATGGDGGIVIAMSTGPAGNLFTSISPAISGLTTWTAANGNIALYTFGTYTFTAAQTFSVSVKIWGAGGGVTTTVANRTGGAGGFAGGTVTFVSGTQYRMIVGQGGAGGGTTVPGAQAGGGGGGSGLEFLNTTSILVAGGGGGGAWVGNAAGGGGQAGQDITGIDNRNGVSGKSGGAVSWTSISAGLRHAGTTNSNYALYMWGWGVYGQLGNNLTNTISSPVLIGVGTSWATVSCGYWNTLAKTVSGSLFAWGRNHLGALGINNTIDISSPVQVGTLSWGVISAGVDIMGGLQNNVLYTWGNGGNGQIGIGTATSRSSPTLVGNNLDINTLTPAQISGSYTQVSAGNQYTIVSDMNNNIFAFGQDTSGQLGLGS